MKNIQMPTLLRLILLGFLLVSLPLVGSIITAIAQVDRLAQESRSAMMSVQDDTIASRILSERTTSMERNARQYQALQDLSFKALYEENREEALAQLEQLASHASGRELADAVVRARESEGLVAELVEGVEGATTASELEAALLVLRDDVLAVVREQNAVSREMAGIFPDNAQTLQRTLIAQATLVIPISAALAILFVLVIARPLRQIGRRILSLGRSDLGEPITVKGARDLELLGQRLEWLRLRLLELEEQKAQFLRNVSHELKTPLTNIREGAELLSEDSANGVAGEYRQVARIVRDNSLRLQQMIEELLRYGSEGDITADQESQLLQFDQLVLAVMERHALTAKAHAVEMIPRLESVELEGNAKRLQVIVENLLSNALKYAPRGGYIMVELAAGPEDVKLDVRDNGPGVPDSDRERVFEWFYTGARPPGSIVAGTGFGLAIAQQYAGQHDGQITLLPSSEGAHFQLTIRKRIA